MSDERLTDEQVQALVARGKEVEALRARVAELEANSARLRVHNVRVVGGVIMGLDEILEGEG